MLSALKASARSIPARQQLVASSPLLRYHLLQNTFRSQSTNANTSSSSANSVDAQSDPSHSKPPPRRSSEPPSKHKLFYREIIPPLVRVLAYGSIVYFSLHLTWQYLDGKEQKKLEEEVRAEMEAQVRQKLKNRGVNETQDTTLKGGSWFGWLRG